MESHIPVMLDEVLSFFTAHIEQDEDFVFVDATLGGGGHAEAMLSTFPHARLIGLDRDGTARSMSAARLAGFGDRVEIIGADFRGMADVLARRKGSVRGAIFDLGVSNMQITSPERGFSFQDDGPLDMRMDSSSGSPTALELLKELDIADMTSIFRRYGEERYAYQLARAIVRARERGSLPATTGEMVALIRASLPAPVQRKMGAHPARRIFQALRIAVNDELGALSDGLAGAFELCADDGGVIEVISYHSLEDRIVKNAFKKRSSSGEGTILTKKPVSPGTAEIERNRSARSAKLRAFLCNARNG